MAQTARCREQMGVLSRLYQEDVSLLKQYAGHLGYAVIQFLWHCSSGIQLFFFFFFFQILSAFPFACKQSVFHFVILYQLYIGSFPYCLFHSLSFCYSAKPTVFMGMCIVCIFPFLSCLFMCFCSSRMDVKGMWHPQIQTYRSESELQPHYETPFLIPICGKKWTLHWIYAPPPVLASLRWA